MTTPLLGWLRPMYQTWSLYLDPLWRHEKWRKR